MLDDLRNPLPLAARGLPESALLPDADAARAVKTRLERTRRYELGILGVLAWTPVLICLGFVVLIVLERVISSFSASWPWAVRVLAETVLPLLIVMVAGVWVQRHVAGLAVREVLLERGIPVCLGCGYDLTAVPPGEPRCPECGRVRTDPGFRGASPDESPAGGLTPPADPPATPSGG